MIEKSNKTIFLLVAYKTFIDFYFITPVTDGLSSGPEPRNSPDPPPRKVKLDLVYTMTAN
jgi:hypothetical protein